MYRKRVLKQHAVDTRLLSKAYLMVTYAGLTSSDPPVGCECQTVFPEQLHLL